MVHVDPVRVLSALQGVVRTGPRQRLRQARHPGRRGPLERSVAAERGGDPGPPRSRPDQLNPQARKLLTFVDNRQDASLQAGHLNDFVQVAHLRGALYRALAAAGPDGLTHETIAPAVTAALGLSTADFAAAPDAKFSAKADAERSLRAVVEYQLYVDLQRGWRITMPNLEQTGLLSRPTATCPSWPPTATAGPTVSS